MLIDCGSGHNAVNYTASFKESAQSEIIESVNRARDFFGDPVKRWNDRLILKGSSYVENYCEGRMALILHCKVSFPVNLPMVGALRDVVGREQESFFIVLKANVAKPHKIEHWDKQLMLVHDVHIVQGPQGPILSSVGLYDIHDNVTNLNSNRVIGKTLLFQSAIYSSYKFFPLIADWKPRAVICAESNAMRERSVVENINRASKIVQCVANNQSCIGRGESCLIDLNEKMVTPFVFLDSDGVEVRFSERIQQLIQVTDVLHGPFNLMS